VVHFHDDPPHSAFRPTGANGQCTTTADGPKLSKLTQLTAGLRAARRTQLAQLLKIGVGFF